MLGSHHCNREPSKQYEQEVNNIKDKLYITKTVWLLMPWSHCLGPLVSFLHLITIRFVWQYYFSPQSPFRTSTLSTTTLLPPLLFLLVSSSQVYSRGPLPKSGMTLCNTVLCVSTHECVHECAYVCVVCLVRWYLLIGKQMFLGGQRCQVESEMVL